MLQRAILMHQLLISYLLVFIQSSFEPLLIISPKGHAHPLNVSQEKMKIYNQRIFSNFNINRNINFRFMNYTAIIHKQLVGCIQQIQIQQNNKQKVDLEMKKQSQLLNQIKKLQYQLSYSQHINKQLSQQLSSICQKSGISIKRLKGNQNIIQINFAKQLQQLYYVEPLLMAYQHKVSLFQQEVKQSNEESKSLQEYAEQIVKENQFLRKELQRKNQYILKSQQIGININFIKLDNQSLTEKNKLLTQKNSFMFQKIKEITKSIENLKKTQNTQLLTDKLQKQAQKQADLRKQIQIQLLNLKGKLQIVTNQLNNQKTLNKQLQRKTGQLENEVSKYKNESKILRQQSESSLMNWQHNKQSLQTQLQTLKGQVSACQRRESQLFTKNMISESELTQKNSKLHNLSLQTTHLQTNNNNLLQMLESYEQKVGSLTKKLKGHQNQKKEQSQGFNEQRKETEIVRWKLEQKEKEMQRKQVENRKEKDRINKMWEQRLQVMRSTFEQQKNSVYQQLKQDKNISNR